jgi:hypothetical protein
MAEYNLGENCLTASDIDTVITQLKQLQNLHICTNGGTIQNKCPLL